MANGKYFLQHLIELMEADNGTGTVKGIQNVYTTAIPIRIADFMPSGNTYPQICLWLDEGQSETVFPAGRYKLKITLWVKKEMRGKYKWVKLINDAVNRLVNRKASSLSDIDVTENEGLRVARCVKEGGDIVFSKQTGLYFSESLYDTVISEDESFDPAVAGNKEWS